MKNNIRVRWINFSIILYFSKYKEDFSVIRYILFLVSEGRQDFSISILLMQRMLHKLENEVAKAHFLKIRPSLAFRNVFSFIKVDIPTNVLNRNSSHIQNNS